MASSTYPAEMKFTTCEQLRVLMESVSLPARDFAPLLPDYVRYAVQWMSDTADRPQDQRFV